MQISSLILLWKWLKSLWAAVWRQPGVLDWHFPFVQKGKVEKSRDAGALVKSLRGHLLELDQKSYVKKKKKKEKETEKESSRGLWVGTVCKAQLCVCVCSNPKPWGIGSGREIRRAPHKALHWKAWGLTQPCNFYTCQNVYQMHDM